MRINPLRTYERIMMKPIPKPHSEGFRDAVYHNSIVVVGTGFAVHTVFSTAWNMVLNWFTSPNPKLVRVVRVQNEGEEQKVHDK